MSGPLCIERTRIRGKRSGKGTVPGGSGWEGDSRDEACEIWEHDVETWCVCRLPSVVYDGASLSQASGMQPQCKANTLHLRRVLVESKVEPYSRYKALMRSPDGVETLRSYSQGMLFHRLLSRLDVTALGKSQSGVEVHRISTFRPRSCAVGPG